MFLKLSSLISKKYTYGVGDNSRRKRKYAHNVM